MADFQYFILMITLGTLGSLLFFPLKSEAVIRELGKVKCTVYLDINKLFFQAEGECYEKMKKEIKENGKDKLDRKPYPHNATLEDYDWDDFCEEHCIYNTTGILSSDGSLPKKTDTATIFGKERVSDERYKLHTSVWDECLDISGEIGKKKVWDNCKMVTHHNICFYKKIRDQNLQIDC